MKARLACIPCFVKQGLTAARLSTPDPALRQAIVDEILRRLQGLSLDASPALLSQIAYATAREMTGVADPFARAKHETNLAALALVPDLRARIAASPDPLRAALKAALSGNVVDLGIEHKYDLRRDVDRILSADLSVDHYDQFLPLLESRPRLLYLCDNSGEIAFDVLLVERLRERCDITAVVKSGPIINDATMRDAEQVGLTSVVPVIETGSDDIGVNWAAASGEFRQAFDGAGLILAKGQANFETLSDRPEEIFFLLKAKCAQVSDELDVPDGGTLFLRNRTRAGRK